MVIGLPAPPRKTGRPEISVTALCKKFDLASRESAVASTPSPESARLPPPSYCNNVAYAKLAWFRTFRGSPRIALLPGPAIGLPTPWLPCSTRLSVLTFNRVWTRRYNTPFPAIEMRRLMRRER
jgi:hypothetical protein